jgi:hypothetical protein
VFHSPTGPWMGMYILNIRNMRSSQCGSPRPGGSGCATSLVLEIRKSVLRSSMAWIGWMGMLQYGIRAPFFNT